MNALRKKSNSFIKKFKSSSVHKQLKSLSKFFEEIAFDKLLLRILLMVNTNSDPS